MKTKSLSLLVASVMNFTNFGCSIVGYQTEEKLTYKVIDKANNKEVREYQPHLAAKTTVKGSFKESQSKGFRILAGFIFGKNKGKTKISMTSPVVQNPKAKSQNIAMTSPVVLTPSTESYGNKTEAWTMSFSMPSKYNKESLPEPDDNRIWIEEVPTKYIAAIKFSGFWNESKNQRKAKELLDWLFKNESFEIISEPMFAGYNPPWTLPFFRRNEMMVELSKKIKETK